MKSLIIGLAMLTSVAVAAQHNVLNSPKWGVTIETGAQSHFTKIDGFVLSSPVKLGVEYIKPLKRNSSISYALFYGITEIKAVTTYNPDIFPLFPPFVYYNPGFGNMISSISLPITYAYHTGRFTRLELGGMITYDMPHDGYKVKLSTEQQTPIPQLFFRSGIRTFLKRKLTLGVHLSGSVTPSEYYGGNIEHYRYGKIPRWNGYRIDIIFSLTRLF